MSRSAFRISRLVVSGRGLSPAEVDFQNGCNVLTGPSNTGKSYIVECLNYMFGAEETPGPELEEAQGYDVGYVELMTDSGNTFTLERSLLGGDVNLYESSYEDRGSVTPRVLAVEAQTKKIETLSAFLLGLFDVKDVKVRSNASGEKANLTFRTISHLFLIDESRIIAKQSPIRLPIGFAKTSSERAFNFLITGQDDHAIIAGPNQKQRKAQNAGKIEVYDELIAALEAKLRDVNLEQIRQRLSEIDGAIKQMLEELSAKTNTIQEFQLARQTAFDQLRESDSRLESVSELLARFQILKQHYASDLSRLEFLRESDHYFDQLSVIRCPLCGTSLESHAEQKMCLENDAVMNDVQGACAAEVVKIESHLRDLQRTIDGLETERVTLVVHSKDQRTQVSRLEKSLTEELGPMFERGKTNLDALSDQRQMLASVEAQFQTLEQYWISRSQLDERRPVASSSFAGLSPFAVRGLCDVVQNLLREWKFIGDMDIVEFNETKMDIVVAGKPRQSNGKGLRGFLFSAFAMGLMHYCRINELPHPGCLIVDSPLTSYREGKTHEAEDEAAPEIQSAFWDSVAKWPESEQLILIENKEPTAAARSSMHYIHFYGKGSTEGRNGFFPQK
jgi:hypothetical protein